MQPAHRAPRAVRPYAGRVEDLALQLAHDLCDARRRTRALLDDLDDDELRVPKLAIVNPPLWELGHVAWFQEKWILRHLAGRPALATHVDVLYDSAAIEHDARWELRLPQRPEVSDYAERVLAAVLQRLDQVRAGDDDAYFCRLATFHEDMHGEAFVYTRQTLGYAAPRREAGPELATQAEPARELGGAACAGDVLLPGGSFVLGARDDEPFVFDNERDAHVVQVAPFRMARCAVSQAEFAEFVEARGYLRDEFWDTAGRRWRDTHLARQPLHWERGDGGRWYRRHYDTLVPLEERHAMLHVNAHEAEAWCRFAGRRLPSEAEWEFAACAAPSALVDGRLRARRRFPWGDERPAPRHAHLDLASAGTLAVDAHADGDSGFGLRQLIGNVWEWTSTTFGPYPGFVAGPYAEYSAPWFGTHRVLRGGAFATRPRLLRNSWRNFYTPDRRDVLAGFRTCALE